MNRLLPPRKTGLDSVVERLASKLDSDFYRAAAHKVEQEKLEAKTQGICLEPLTQSENAQMQSWTTGFEYKEIQKLKHGGNSSVVVGPTGRELPRGDINGALDRSKSPTSSEGSKENIEDDFDMKSENVDDNSNTVKYPCPVCKQGFAKISNVYKHLTASHGKSR